MDQADSPAAGARPPRDTPADQTHLRAAVKLTTRMLADAAAA